MAASNLGSVDRRYSRPPSSHPFLVLRGIGFIAVASILGSALPVSAQICGNGVTPPAQFTDEAEFLAAVGSGLSFESFEGLLTGSIDNSTIDPNGFQVADPGSRLGINDSNEPNNAHPSDGSQYLAWNSVPPSDLAITFTFDSPITAFGMFVIDPLDTPTGTGGISLSTDGGQSIPDFVTIVDPNWVPSGSQFFVGVIGSAPFSVVTFTTTNNLADSIIFDGVHYGTAVCCGDGEIGPGEQCDDENVDPGDGCSATCQLESPPIPTLTPLALLFAGLMVLGLGLWTLRIRAS